MSLKVQLRTMEELRETRARLKQIKEELTRTKFRRTVQREVRGLPSMWDIP